MFKLEMETGNDAFGDNAFTQAIEISRILDKISEDINNGHDHGSCVDINGNKVGSWSID